MGKKSTTKAGEQNAQLPKKKVTQEQLKDIDDLFSSLKSKKRKAEDDAEQDIEPKSRAAKTAKQDISVEGAKDHSKASSDAADQRRKVKRVPLRAQAAAQPEADEFSAPYGVIKSGRGDISVRIISPEAPLERIDAESGLPVYKAHLLKVGEGGGTPLCPFDCDCCF